MGFFDGVKDFFVGSDAKTEYIKPEDKIAKADATEQGLYDSLGASNTNNMAYADYLSGNRQGIYDQAMQGYQDYNTNLGNLSYDGMLNDATNANLQGILNNQIANIDNYANTGVGQTMNQYANRGVLNSSATGRAFGDIANQANNQKNDAYSNYMNQYMNSYNNQYGADVNQLQMQNQAIAQPYGFLDSAYQSAYSNPYNMWDNIRSDRYGLTQDIVQTPSTTGFLQSVGGGLGEGIGSGVGGLIASSDRRLKENITKVKEQDGTDCQIDGHQIYDWDWNAEGEKLTEQKQGRGVIAQEVQETRPDAIITDDPSGFLMVDYTKLFAEVKE